MYKYVKDILDRFFALVGIIVTLPLFLIVTLLVLLDGKGNVLFRQERNGKGADIFNIIKFRTMRSTHVHFDTGRQVIEDSDKHLTRVGRVLRKLKLDEIPQLFNILVGDMSFVGPRPLLPDFYSDYKTWEKGKFGCKPGLTGLAQVNGNGYLRRLSRSYYDVKYCEELSFLLDCKIFFKTIPVVILGEKFFLCEISNEAILEKAAECGEDDLFATHEEIAHLEKQQPLDASSDDSSGEISEIDSDSFTPTPKSNKSEVYKSAHKGRDSSGSLSEGE